MLDRVGQPIPQYVQKPAFGASGLRFGSAVQTVAKEVAEVGQAEIKNLKLAQKIWQGLSKVHFFKEDLRLWNMSLEDWASRFNVALAVYLPMAYFSFKEDKHKWETNGRNVLLWFTTIGLARLVKHDKYGVNTVLNQFMVPKAVPEAGKKLSPIARALNKIRPDFNYFELLEEVGIEVKDKSKAAWASLDKNQLDLITVGLEKKLQQAQNSHPELVPRLKNMLEKEAPQFLKRVTSFKFLAAMTQAALTVYIIGILAMEIVFRYIAPRDKDFDPEKYKKATTRLNPAKYDVGAAQPSFSQPRLFKTMHAATAHNQGGQA